MIHYRVEWKTVISEFKRVSYNVLPHSTRTMTVDRQYFDTAEGAHTTNVGKVTVDMITCVAGAYANSPPPHPSAARGCCASADSSGCHAAWILPLPRPPQIARAKIVRKKDATR